MSQQSEHVVRQLPLELPELPVPSPSTTPLSTGKPDPELPLPQLPSGVPVQPLQLIFTLTTNDVLQLDTTGFPGQISVKKPHSQLPLPELPLPQQVQFR
jgi:hypothetical protein